MEVFPKPKTITSISAPLTRDELLRRSRILVIDDQRPDIVDDLKKAHFAVDYEPDIDAGKIDLIDKQIYDLILLDFWERRAGLRKRRRPFAVAAYQASKSSRCRYQLHLKGARCVPGGLLPAFRCGTLEGRWDFGIPRKD